MTEHPQYSLETLKRLTDLINERKDGDPDTSYVARLFSKGGDKISEKVGEEAIELIIASVKGDTSQITYEAADLLFHLMILLSHHNLSLSDIAQELRRREGLSGLDEKAARQP